MKSRKPTDKQILQRERRRSLWQQGNEARPSGCALLPPHLFEDPDRDAWTAGFEGRPQEPHL